MGNSIAGQDARHASARAGFSLLELAVALAVIGVVTAGALEVLTAFSANQSRKITRERIAAVQEALVLHAAREGFLPCPGDATQPDDGAARFQGADPDDQTDCTAGRDIVALPWEDLGIARESTFDGWGRRLTYAVYDGPDGVTRPGGLDMLTCSCPGPDCARIDPPDGDGGGTLADCTSADLDDHVREFLRGKGLTVLTDATDGNSAFHDPAQGTGAAFVVISHGANALGAYGQAGYVGDVPGSRDDEDENDTIADDTFVKTRQDESGKSSHFDDLITAMRIDELARAARLYLPE